jgi:regulator of protease activity HflC (stomatin/prohibitin superfamily)
MELVVIAVAVIAALAIFALWRNTTKTIVYDYQQALKYVDGKLVGIVGAGRYVSFTERTTYSSQDMRKLPFAIAGQEVPTKDNISVRISLTGHYQVVDLRKAVHDNYSFHGDIHTTAQLAMRDAVAHLSLDELLSSKEKIDAAVMEKLKSCADTHGVTVTDLVVKDIILPVNLKKAMAGVVEAQKEAARNLEKARGEQAVLRSLANAARLYSENPQLANARVIQSLDAGGNTVVFGTESILPTKKSK